MHVCFISNEYFGWGKYGGIGRATRDIATGLADRSVKVSVVVPLGRGQRGFETVDKVDVHGFPLAEYPLIGGLLKGIDADVYHSQDLSLGTWLAKHCCGDSVHLLTCQNPKSRRDWELVNQYYPMRRKIYNSLVEPRVIKQVKELDHVYCQAKYTLMKTKRLYGLDYTPDFLPNPVIVPSSIPKKSDTPLIIFLGRFDGEKNPERFLRLAQRYPDARFIAAGRPHDPVFDEKIRQKYTGIENLRMPGFIDGEDKIRLLDEAWILVNTSVSECLPVSFLEATAHGCAILSPHNPDGFASRFGLHTQDIESGLGELLIGDWREKGELGYIYVRETHEMRHVIDTHINEYEKYLR